MTWHRKRKTPEAPDALSPLSAVRLAEELLSRMTAGEREAILRLYRHDLNARVWREALREARLLEAMAEARKAEETKGGNEMRYGYAMGEASAAGELARRCAARLAGEQREIPTFAERQGLLFAATMSPQRVRRMVAGHASGARRSSRSGAIGRPHHGTKRGMA